MVPSSRSLLPFLVLLALTAFVLVPPTAAQVAPYPGHGHFHNDVVRDSNGDCTGSVRMTYALLPLEEPFAIRFETLPDCTVEIYEAQLQGIAFASTGAWTVGWTVSSAPGGSPVGYGYVETTVSWAPPNPCPINTAHDARAYGDVVFSFTRENPDPCLVEWTTQFLRYPEGLWTGQTGGAAGGRAICQYTPHGSSPHACDIRAGYTTSPGAAVFDMPAILRATLAPGSSQEILIHET